MGRYQIWNRTDDIYTASGQKLTAAEWMEHYQWLKNPGAKMIITTGVINGKTALEFQATKELFRNMGAAITDEMSDEEVLAAIEEFEDNPPRSNEPTVEERTAAALEFLALNSLPDNN